jgi:signal transduction histidine kinase
LLGQPVGSSLQPPAALVGVARPWMREECEAFLAEAAPKLAAVLERDSLLAGNAASEREQLEASRRRLTRMGFDLHDGPIQDVALLAEDVRLFGDQLKPLLGALDEHQLVRGRIEDLDSQLAALDAGLRRLSHEVRGATLLLNRPFGMAVHDHCEAFFARTGIEPRLSIDGDIATISTSQQIALLNIINQALNNIREHANANAVEVAVTVTEEGVDARVSDDGQGFDLEQTLIRAAREGRVGLLAINERTRLLGGRCRIDSRPGGPTVVSVAFARWLPLPAIAERARASS